MSPGNRNIPLPYYILPIILIITSFYNELKIEVNKGLWDNEPSEWREVLDLLIFSNGVGNAFNPEDSILNRGFLMCIDESILNIGREQKINWAKKMYNALEDSTNSAKRLNILKNALTNSESSLFVSAREEHEREKNIFELQSEKLKKIRIKTAKEYLITLALIQISILLISIVCSILLTRLSKKCIPLFRGFEKWKHVYFYLTIALFLANLSLSIITSIFEHDKQWIIPASFFVSWEAWSWERVSVLGLCMINAIPLTQLWCYTRKEYIPNVSLEDLGGTDGKYTVEKYIVFLQICTIAIFISLSLIAVILLKWSSSQQNNFDSSYLIGEILLSILLLLFVVRLIRNAILIRFNYQNEIAKKFKSFDKLQGEKILPDPTIDFIGESWWKLPVNFISIATAIWALFNLTGISNIILSAIK